MDPISIGMTLMKFAPSIAGWIFKKDVSDKVSKVVEVAQTISGEKDEDKILAKLEKDKDLAASFQHAVASMELEILREENKRIDAVNQTMRAESKSEKWPQYSWRPFNGFLFGITLFSNYIIFPLFGKPTQSIPEIVFVMWGAVLGVTAWHRGVQKREESSGGIKTNLGNVISRTLK
ncbi:holin family protein [bacterium]|nr:holin family protein [bacterium]